MPGANYMGGKRNAAKARSKDSIGRIQKGFFSKKRLDMLSRGLAQDRNDPGASRYPGTREPGLPDIGFAHAVQAIQSNQDNPGYILSPTQFSPRTPSSQESRKRLGQTSSSSSNAQSEVIMALDTSEPLLFRAAMDRILALPDLAGLTRRYMRPEAPVTPMSYKRPVPDEDWERSTSHSPVARQHKKQKTIPREPENIKYASDSFSSGDRWPDKLEERSGVASNSPGISHIFTSPFQPIINQPNLSTSQENSWSLDMDDDDIYYSDFRFGLTNECDDERKITSSPKKVTTPVSEFQITSQPSRSPTLSFGGNYSSPSYADAQPPSPRTPGTTHGNNHTQPYPYKHPTFHTGNTSPMIHKFSSNNLFEHKNPWHTIGVILGLSPASQTYGSPNSNMDFTETRTKSRDSVSSEVGKTLPRQKLSLPPSSPPTNQSTSSKSGRPSSLEPYKLFSPHSSADISLSFESSSILAASPSISAPKIRYSPVLDRTDYSSSPEITGPSSGDRSPTQLTGSSPSSLAFTPFDNDIPGAENTNSDPHCQSRRNNFTPNKTHAPSFPRLTFQNGKINNDVNLDNILSPSIAVSNNSTASNISSPFAELTGNAPPIMANHETNGPEYLECSLPETRDNTQFPMTGVPSGVSVIPTPSTPRHSNGLSSLQLTEVNGIFQGPCLFPEDSGSDSDGP